MPHHIPSEVTNERTTHPVIGLIMGSRSDWSTLQYASEILDSFAICYEARIVSAHRTPQRLYDYARTARERGLKVIIAAAGGAAHLPGMMASLVSLPVFGVPVQSTMLNGIDSLLSIVQMPAGIPVGTLAIGRAGAINAALLAATVLGLSDTTIAAAVEEYRIRQTANVDHTPFTSPQPKTEGLITG